MAVSGANMGFSIMRIMAENAVESSKASKASVRANSLVAEQGAHQKKAAIEEANSKKSVQGTIQVVQSGVQAGKATIGAAKSVGNLPKEMKVNNDLHQAFDRADTQRTQTAADRDTDSVDRRSTTQRTRTDRQQDTRQTTRREATTGQQSAGGQDALGGIMEVDMGDGRTISQRFSQPQMELLSRGSFTTAQLREANFSPAEVRWLTQVSSPDPETPGVRTIDNDTAVNFVMRNRTSQEDQWKQQGKDAVKSLIIKSVVDTVNNGLKEGDKKARKEGARAMEDGQKARGVADQLGKAESEHNEKLGEAMIELIRGEFDQNRV